MGHGKGIGFCWGMMRSWVNMQDPSHSLFGSLCWPFASSAGQTTPLANQDRRAYATNLTLRRGRVA